MPQEVQVKFEIILVAELAQDPITGLGCVQYSRASVQTNGQPSRVFLTTPNQDPVVVAESALRQAMGTNPKPVIARPVTLPINPPVDTGPAGGLTPWAGVELDLFAFQKKFKSRGTRAVRGDTTACAGVLSLLRMIETKRTLITLAELRDPAWLARVLATLPPGWKIHKSITTRKDALCYLHVVNLFRALDGSALYGLRGEGCFYFGKQLPALLASLEQNNVVTLNAADFDLHQPGYPLFDPSWANEGEVPVPMTVSLNETPCQTQSQSPAAP